MEGRNTQRETIMRSNHKQTILSSSRIFPEIPVPKKSQLYITLLPFHSCGCPFNGLKGDYRVRFYICMHKSSDFLYCGSTENFRSYITKSKSSEYSNKLNVDHDLRTQSQNQVRLILQGVVDGYKHNVLRSLKMY